MSERSFAPTQQTAPPVVSQVPGGLLQRQCACGQHAIGGECDGCRKKHSTLQRKSTGGRVPSVPPIVSDVLRSPGQPLDASTRAFFEPRFGHDFSRVRVHTGPRAAASAAAVDATAYTVGQDVAFGSNQFSPETSAGRRLIAHELTHTMQQGSTSVQLDTRIPLTTPDGPAEREAQSVERAVMGGQAIGPISKAQLQVARQHLFTPATTPDFVTQSNAPAVVPGLANPILPTVSGNDEQTLTETMQVVEGVKPSEVASGLYTTIFRGQKLSLTQAQRDALIAAAKKAIRDNLRRAKDKAESAQERYQSQSEVDKQHYIVAPIVKFLGRIRDPGHDLLIEVIKAEAGSVATLAFLESNKFAQAATALAETETSAVKAQKLWQAYFEGIIGAGEMTVTVLEYTRDASFVTLGVLAIIATGGAAAGAAGAAGTTTTAFGLEVGTASAANLIATGAPIVATVGGAVTQAALGDKVDWAKVGVDIAVNLILSRFGGKLSNGIFKSLLGSPAVRSAGEVFVGRIVSSVLTHEASTIFTTTVDAVYRKFKGQNVTWDHFTDELIVRLTDPKGLVVASVMGAVVAGADVKLGGARGVQIEDKSGSKGELDVVRAGVITEEKSATGLGKINPRTGQPFNKITEVEWAENQIYNKTKVRLDNLKIATATRPTPEGSREVPTLKEVQRITKYEFSIKADTPALRVEVEKQLVRLRASYPDWSFSAKYGK